jgi:hypothetical protein
LIEKFRLWQESPALAGGRVPTDATECFSYASLYPSQTVSGAQDFNSIRVDSFLNYCDDYIQRNDTHHCSGAQHDREPFLGLHLVPQMANTLFHHYTEADHRAARDLQSSNQPGPYPEHSDGDHQFRPDRPMTGAQYDRFRNCCCLWLWPSANRCSAFFLCSQRRSHASLWTGVELTKLRPTHIGSVCPPGSGSLDLLAVTRNLFQSGRTVGSKSPFKCPSNSECLNVVSRAVQ